MITVLTDVATVVGYFVVSRPFLNLADPRHIRSSHSKLLQVVYGVIITTVSFVMTLVSLCNCLHLDDGQIFVKLGTVFVSHHHHVLY